MTLDQFLSQKDPSSGTDYIRFLGKQYSFPFLYQTVTDTTKLQQGSLPILQTDRHLEAFFQVDEEQLKYLIYHNPKENGNYHSVEIPKKNGDFRQISIPNPLLKRVQHIILSDILEKVPVNVTM